MNPTAIDHQVLTLLLKGALFSAVAAAAGCALARRCSAQTMSLYWRASVLGLFALPMVSFYLPILPLFEAAPATPVAPELAPSAANSEWRVSYPDSDEVGAAIARESDAAGASIGERVTSSTSFSWVLSLWLAGAALVVGRWAIARLAASRLCRGAEPAADPRWTDALRSHGVSPRRVKILVSPKATLPMVCGSLRSVLLLPREALQWDPQTLRAVFAHELAHVRRHDALFLLIAQCAVALHWMNPLVWFAARRLRLADERSADDSVLASGSEPASYASLLLKFAKRGPAPALGLPLAAPSMAHRSTVRLRVERLLDDRQQRGAPRLRSWLGGCLTTLAIAFAIGASTTKDAVAQGDGKAPAAAGGESAPEKTGEGYIRAKLKSTILPSIQFDEATLQEAVEFLRLKSAEFDKTEKDKDKRGINIVVRKDAEKAAATITLQLTEIPLELALKYVTQLAGVKFRVDPIGVVIGKDFTQDLFLRTFRVPPDFTDSLFAAAGGDADPFGGDAPPAPPKSLREAFEAHGITFPEGASVIHIKATSSLVVRNTQNNMDLITVLLEKFEADLPGVIKMRVELYEMPKGEALKIITAADRQPAAGAAIESVRKLIESGDATLLASPSMITRSGQRAKIEAGESIEYVSSYREQDGKDSPVMRTVLAGTSVEVEPVVGADNRTLDVNIAISMARGKPTITKRKMVGPASGIEREIESVAISSQQLTLAFTTLTGQTQLVGNLQSDTIDDPNAVLAFVTATITKVKPE